MKVFLLLFLQKKKALLALRNSPPTARLEAGRGREPPNLSETARCFSEH